MHEAVNTVWSQHGIVQCGRLPVCFRWNWHSFGAPSGKVRLRSVYRIEAIAVCRIPTLSACNPDLALVPTMRSKWHCILHDRQVMSHSSLCVLVRVHFRLTSVDICASSAHFSSHVGRRVELNRLIHSTARMSRKQDHAEEETHDPAAQSSAAPSFKSRLVQPSNLLPACTGLMLFCTAAGFGS